MTIERQHLVLTAIAVGLVAAYLITDRLVETAEEKVRRVVDTVVEALARADADAIAEQLAPGYSHEGLGRQAVRQFAERFFKLYGPARASVRECRVNVTGQIGVADLNVYAEVERETIWRGRGSTSRWRLSFVRYGGRWYIDRISPISMARSPVGSFRSLMRFASRRTPWI